MSQEKVTPMTLCIVQRLNNGNVQFWSDSRITINNKVFDTAIKVVKVPVTIFKIQNRFPDYGYDWGMCFAGSANTIYYIKDTIYENLLQLEYADDRIELSFDKFIDYVEKVFGLVSERYISELGGDGYCKLIIGGYCPKHKQIRVFELDLVPTGFTTFRTNRTEISINIPYTFIGNGREAARKALESGITNPYDIIKEVSKEHDQVGGQIQFGEFNDRDFKIKGYIEKVGDEFRVGLRGLDMTQDMFSPEITDLHLTIPYVIKRSDIQDLKITLP